MFKLKYLYILTLILLIDNSYATSNSYQFEIIDLLGLSSQAHRLNKKQQTSIRNSASQFLLEIYNEINVEEHELERRRNNKQHIYNSRYKRTLYDDNFLTKADRIEIEKSNSIITFSSKNKKFDFRQYAATNAKAMHITFKTNAVPLDLQLMHSALRIYQDPELGKFQQQNKAITVSVYQKFYNYKLKMYDFQIFTSLNTTTLYKGWYEFNVTRLLKRWLPRRRLVPRNEIVIKSSLAPTATNKALSDEISTRDIGLVPPHPYKLVELQPFIIGYFNGPDLMTKVQKLRFKREVLMRKQKTDNHMQQPRPIVTDVYAHKPCERQKFTIDFRELHMHTWIIEPEKFEAYFCGGVCNFPLGSKMNATNHAIVQTLMHLRKPNIPKPCCVPTTLGAISVLHYLDEDSVNLSRYPQSVAKECGCL